MGLIRKLSSEVSSSQLVNSVFCTSPGQSTSQQLLHFTEKADELFCFGWVQDRVEDGKHLLVGEARCRKHRAQEMLSTIESLAVKSGGRAALSFKEYEDSKARLHFSHFKVLPPTRITCFRDEPHQCQKWKDGR